MERLCTPPEACTGLVFGIDGEGYVSSGSTVYRFDVRRDAGAYELVSWSEAVAPRGHAILADGDHILCDGARVVRISRDGERRDALATAILSAPRDLCAAPGNEGVFVVGAGDDSDSLLYVPLATDDAVVLDDTLEQPTAVALSPDDRTLYVIESATGRVLAYDLAGSGSIGPRRELATLPGGEGVAQDVCVDKDGFLWLARGTAIDVLGADGRHVARIPTPAITSLAFGDSSLRVMFCAGGGSEGGGIVGRYFVGVRGVAVARNRE